MRGIISTAALLLFGAVTVGCSSNNIRADYDRTVDFGDYETYSFYNDAGPENTKYQSFFSKYMVSATAREMEARGYVKSGDPDLLVNFNAVLQEKTKVTTTPSSPSMGVYYGYRRGFYDPWAGYNFGTETRVSQYTEGTFNIDLVDANKKQLVWEAVGVGRVTQKKLENLEQSVNEGVPKFFALYPFRAGDGTPIAAQK